MRAVEETLLGADGSALFDALSFWKQKNILVVATVIKAVHLFCISRQTCASSQFNGFRFSSTHLVKIKSDSQFSSVHYWIEKHGFSVQFGSPLD